MSDLEDGWGAESAPDDDEFDLEDDDLEDDEDGWGGGEDGDDD